MSWNTRLPQEEWNCARRVAYFVTGGLRYQKKVYLNVNGRKPGRQP